MPPPVRRRFLLKAALAGAGIVVGIAVDSSRAATMTEIPNFLTREAAQDFLAKTLPVATAANPRYRTGEGMLTAWVTGSAAFRTEGPKLIVVMKERIVESRNGKAQPEIAHDVEFSLDDVDITELSGTGELTEDDKPAVGVLFRCRAGACIRSAYGAKAGHAEQTDISLQDDVARSGVLSAFRMLQSRR